MKFYAYAPKDGKEPMGTDRKLLFELKSIKGAHRRAQRVLGERYGEYVLFTYTNFYNDKTFKKV